MVQKKFAWAFALAAILILAGAASATDTVAVLKVTPETRGAERLGTLTVKVLVANYSGASISPTVSFEFDPASGISGVQKTATVPANSTIEIISDPATVPQGATIGQTFYITASIPQTGSETPEEAANNSATGYAFVARPQNTQGIPELPAIFAPVAAIVVVLVLARKRR